MSLSELLATSALADEIEFLAVRLFAAGTRLANERLAEVGLRARSYAVLALAAADLPVRQRDLAALLELDPSQIVALVGELEVVGLVRREPDATDRRANLVIATGTGVAALAQAREITELAERDSLAALTDEEREALRALLRKVVLAQTARTEER